MSNYGRIHNFTAGPAVLPIPEDLSWHCFEADGDRRSTWRDARSGGGGVVLCQRTAGQAITRSHIVGKIRFIITTTENN